MLEPQEQQRHRAGILKQQNKRHKHGHHRSKGSLEVLNKGRVQNKVNVKKFRKTIGREERRNQLVQHRQKKKDELLKQMRGLNDAPIFVALVPLSDDINYFDILDRIKKADEEAIVSYAPNGYTYIKIPRFKKRFMFMIADTTRLYHTLDTLKAADLVLFLVSTEGLCENVDIIMPSVIAQGLPTSIFAITNLQNIPVQKRSSVKNDIKESLSPWLQEQKIIGLETQSDIMTLFRQIGCQKLRSITYRDRRPYLVAEAIEFSNNDKGKSSDFIVSGYLRGNTALSPNDLIHIPGWRDFRLKRIDIVHDPYKEINKDKPMKGPDTATLLPIPEKQETLQSEVIPDPMDAEQTWPTEEELKEAHEKRVLKKSTPRHLVKKIPKGFSEYQASWIPDEDAEEISDGSSMEEEDNDEEMKEVTLTGSNVEDDDRSFIDDSDTMTIATEDKDPNKYDKDIDTEEEKKARVRFQEAREDKMFPDEIDTPLDVPARIRFQKYRGMKSFRTSPWDPKENLPADYARIFQFENFDRTKKKVLKTLVEKTGVSPGSYVRLYLEGVTESEFMALDKGGVMMVVGMLPHEQKMSVLNMVLKKPNNVQFDGEPIKSKDEFIFQCGYRRFTAHPIFSEHTSGTIHKYERFFHPESTVVATTYAPITFPPCPILVFKESPNSDIKLIATGSLLSVNPDRIVVKRTVLSGHPFKVNKKSAVIRFMFYNREDIEWFKPVELRTKYGRRGHIKVPLGTHGHMKCVFDNQIKSQDTVLLNLYKRVFPKWTYSNYSTALYIDET